LACISRGAFLLTIGVGVAWFNNLYIGLALVVGGLLSLTTQYRLRVDFTNYTYYDYVWVLGLTHGEKKRFNKAECIFP
jgi:hypothetical protein